MKRWINKETRTGGRQDKMVRKEGCWVGLLKNRRMEKKVDGWVY